MKYISIQDLKDKIERTHMSRLFVSHFIEKLSNFTKLYIYTRIYGLNYIYIYDRRSCPSYIALMHGDSSWHAKAP